MRITSYTTWGNAALAMSVAFRHNSTKTSWRRTASAVTPLGALLLAAPAIHAFAAAPSSAAISFATLPSSVTRYGKFEAVIAPFSTSAANNYWPYDNQAPVGDTTGLTVGAGVTVDALFLPPGTSNWANAKVQPCFWYQPMQTITQLDGTKVPTPSGNPGWVVRYAPDTTGNWQVKIRVTDRDGVRESAASTFKCSASSAKGFVRVSTTDSRYFEYADGTPFISAAGISERDPAKFPLIASSFNLNRVLWQASDAGSQAPFGLSGQGGAKDWSNDGTFTGPPAVAAPNNHLIVKALNAGQVTLINVAPGGFGKKYQWRALVKTVGVAGPARTDGSLGANFGPTLYCTDNAAGTDVPVNKQWLSGDNDWTWIGGTFVNNLPGGGFRWMKMGLPNATAGTCYIAETSVREVLPDGTLGPELAIHPVPNPMQSYSQEDSFNCDQQVDAAAANNMYLKVVLFEKSDAVTASVQADGTIGNPDDNNTYGVSDRNTVNIQRWYQRAALRYFAARWGWSPNIHSVEFLNEGDPFNGNHYNGANAFADYIHQVNSRPMLATTSFWHSMPTFWNSSSCDYIDVHKYIGPQGGNNLQEGYGSWNVAPTVPDPERGQVLELKASDVSLGPSFWMTPMPVAVGHTYRLRFALKGKGLTKTDPATGNASPYPGGPSFSVRIYSGQSNAPTVQDWSAGAMVTEGAQEGTFDWQERVTPTFTITNTAAKYLGLDAETHWTAGTAQFDDIRLEDVTDPKNPVLIPVPNGTFDECGYIKCDTALQIVDAWKQYAGGGGSLPRPNNKPIIWGEHGISGDKNYGDSFLGLRYTGEDQELNRDTDGVWLHKLIWAGIAPGGVEPILWWNNTVYAYSLFNSAKAYQKFMTGIVIDNGRYVDAQPVCTDGLRAWGQKDPVARKAHLWIDNPAHTWGNVVSGNLILPKSGVVYVSGFAANTSYTVQWWNTRLGTITNTQKLTADANGGVSLVVNALATDVAVKINP